MLMDKITEEIAHFIGLFALTVEQARLRKEFEEFLAERQQAQADPELEGRDWQTDATLVLDDFDPSLRYVPLAPELIDITLISNVEFAAPEIAVRGLNVFAYPGFLMPPWDVVLNLPKSMSMKMLPPPLDPPGELAIVGVQRIWLDDNDYVNVGGSGYDFQPTINFNLAFEALVDSAMQLSPLGAARLPGSYSGLKDFVDETNATLTAFAKENADNPQFHIVHGDSLGGSYVNGELVSELPELDDHWPRKDGAEEDAEINSKPVGFVAGTGNYLVNASVTLEAGGNTLINSAFLTKNWLSGHVLAVKGDYVSLNAIIQVNAWMDYALVSNHLAGWNSEPDQTTKAFNIATFLETKSEFSPGDTGKIADVTFPKHWAVTKIEGDLMFLNWIDQFTFMMDNDIAILASSGVKTFVNTGGNLAISEISLFELGFYYDLIIVGGSVYKLNVIDQMNVMLNASIIGAVEGFETSGPGTVSTSNNLLWNQATIMTYASASFGELPSHYAAAMDALAKGSDDLPPELLSDMAFVGFLGLRVLYVSGDIFDVTYVKQTNILGDADQVALAMNALEPHPDAEWTISTGSNVLVNQAGIASYDGADVTYVGGTHYSYELLIQADFVASDPDLGGQDPDALINEAVVFLGDDMLDSAPGDETAISNSIVPDASQADVMQSVLA